MHYKEINWAKATVDDVYDYVDNLSDNTEFLDFCKFIYKNHQDLEVDWVKLLYECISNLSRQNAGQVLRQFVPWFASVNPNYLAKDYPYFEEQLAYEYLYHEEIENITQRLNLIKKNPVPELNRFSINFFYHLLYYGFYNQAIDYGKAVFRVVENSEDKWVKANCNFRHIFYFDALQHAYLAFKQTGKLDTSKIFELAKDYEIDQNPAVFERELFALQNDLDASALVVELKSRSGNELDKTLAEITVHYAKYMFDAYQMPFCVSVCFFDFINSEKLLGKNKSHGFFYFTEKNFAKHLETKADFVYDSNVVIIFGMIWGLQYVYDFLEKYGLISVSDASLINKELLETRKVFVGVHEANFWLFNYIFKWPKHEQWIDFKPEFDLCYTETPEKKSKSDTWFDDFNNLEDSDLDNFDRLPF